MAKAVRPRRQPFAGRCADVAGGPGHEVVMVVFFQPMNY